jgi:hypothetical protein
MLRIYAKVCHDSLDTNGMICSVCQTNNNSVIHLGRMPWKRGNAILPLLVLSLCYYVIPCL